MWAIYGLILDCLWTVSDGMIMPKICGITIPKFKE
nr:MAG TPA: hypothetical protein [Caudoviricetes sp.]